MIEFLLFLSSIALIFFTSFTIKLFIANKNKPSLDICRVLNKDGIPLSKPSVIIKL